MTYKVLKHFTAKTKQGEFLICPGQIIDLNVDIYPSQVESLVQEGKIKQITITEALSFEESQTIEKEVEKILSELNAKQTKPKEGTLEEIIWSLKERVMKAVKGIPHIYSGEIRAIEDEIDRLCREVLTGQGRLPDFQSACEKYILICKESLGTNEKN